MLYSAIIREASSYNKWEQIHNPTVRHYTQIWRDLRILWTSPSNLCPQGTLQKRMLKECESQRGWRTQENKVPLSQLSKTDTN